MRTDKVIASLMAAVLTVSMFASVDGANPKRPGRGDDSFNRFDPPNKKFGEAIGIGAPFTQYTPLAVGAPWILDLRVKWMREDMNTGPVNPSPGVYRFDAGRESKYPTMHERFQFYADNNINVVVLLYGRNPTAYPDEPRGYYRVGAYGDYALAVAKQLETYGFEFVLEIMNEPHGIMKQTFGGHQQGGSPGGGVAPWMKRYVAMANDAIQKVKAHNPKIKIITDDDLWICHYWMVQAGIDNRLDGFAIHPYHKPFPGKGNNYNVPYWKMVNDDQSRRSNLQRVRHEYESKLGHSVAPYSTEVGFSIGEEGGAHDTQKEEVIAAYLPREFIIEFAAGVEVIQWFALKMPFPKFGDPFGLVENATLKKRMPYAAMKTMVQQLGDYYMIDQIAGRTNTVAGTQAYLFKNDADNCKVAIWDIMDDSKDISATRTVRIDLNAAKPDKVQLHDIYGKQLKKTFDSKGYLQLEIGISPIYVDGVGRDVTLAKCLCEE